jgi:hypothetical protein
MLGGFRRYYRWKWRELFVRVVIITKHAFRSGETL